MPAQALVIVRFGPYASSSGLVDHRIFRLQGLQAVLVSDGHQVVMEESLDRNIVELVVNGETVFQCNIKELEFGGDGQLDPLCQKARKAVLRAYLQYSETSQRINKPLHPESDIVDSAVKCRLHLKLTY